MKNDILTDLKQGLHDYEKLRKENPDFLFGESLINLSLIPISQFISLLIYDHFVGHIPPSLPSEEIIIDIISRSKKTREEAIEYYMTHYKPAIVAYGYVACALFSPLIPLTLLAYEKDPGEKILKYSYTLGKTVRNGFGRIKSYLKGMQELKQKRIEVIKNER